MKGEIWLKTPSGLGKRGDLGLQGTVFGSKADAVAGAAAQPKPVPFHLSPLLPGPQVIKGLFPELAHFSFEYKVAIFYESFMCTKSLTCISLFQPHKNLSK